MALGDEKSEVPGAYYIKCPSCGKRHCLHRTWCDCHTRLEQAVRWTDKPETVTGGRVNVEYPNVTCADCGAGCEYCHSFAVLKTNHRGFVGEKCVGARDSIRCRWCGAIQKTGFDQERAKGTALRMRELWQGRKG